MPPPRFLTDAGNGAVSFEAIGRTCPFAVCDVLDLWKPSPPESTSVGVE
jgi:hypothetical protein